MPRYLLIAAVGLLIFIFISNSFSFRDNLFSQLFPKPPSFAAEPDEIIVKFKKQAPEATRENVRKKHNLTKESTIESKDEEDVDEQVLGESTDNSTTGTKRVKKKKLQIELVKVPTGNRDNIIEALRKDPNVEYAEPNHIGELQSEPNDPSYSSQWNLTQVQAPSAWDINTGNPPVVTAVLDSGLNKDHSDFIGKTVPGYNFYDNNDNTTDVNGHGTSVAGVVAAATNNAVGIASLGYNTIVMPVRVASKEGWVGFYTGAAGLIYAVDNGAKVLNLSWGAALPVPSRILDDTVKYAWEKGVVVVAAAGNSGVEGIYYPASANNVLAVGATRKTGARANFSATGDQLDVMAPGEEVYTTSKNGNYSNASGTSFASPHVVALAALMFAANPSLTNQQVVDFITSTADDMGTLGKDKETGYGRINAAAALARAVGNPPPAPISTPTPSLPPAATPTPTGDVTQPTVSILTPVNNAQVSGNVIITAQASDPSGIDDVKFQIDGVIKSRIASSPYVYTWDSKSVVDGNHIIAITATDKAGNTKKVKVTVNVAN